MPLQRVFSHQAHELLEYDRAIESKPVARYGDVLGFVIHLSTRTKNGEVDLSYIWTLCAVVASCVAVLRITKTPVQLLRISVGKVFLSFFF